MNSTRRLRLSGALAALLLVLLVQPTLARPDLRPIARLDARANQRVTQGLDGVTLSGTLADPLVVQLFCEALGASRYACETNVTGGVSPYTYSWLLNGVRVNFGSSFSSGCFPGSRTSVQVTVTDSQGTQASARASVLCQGGPPR